MLKGTLAKRIKKPIRGEKAGSSKAAPFVRAPVFPIRPFSRPRKGAGLVLKKSLPLKDCYPDLRRINY